MVVCRSARRWTGICFFWGLRLPLTIGGLIGLAELLDETSFGARVFGFEPPALYGGGDLMASTT